MSFAYFYFFFFNILIFIVLFATNKLKIEKKREIHSQRKS